MAYKGKYSRKQTRVSPFFTLLGVIVVPVALALTVLLLGKMVQSMGRPKAAVQNQTADQAILQQFDGFVSGQLDSAREALSSASVQETVPEVTETPVREKVIYEIPADVQVAPEPNPECYGQTDDPSTLQWLLDHLSQQ